MLNVILAIDAGTTGVTAVLVTEDGLIIARGYSEFPQSYPEPGLVEHDLGDIWAAVRSACSQVLVPETVRPVAVGLTNQRETACFWDPDTLEQIRPAIVWQDRRSHGICDELASAGLGSEVHTATGLRLDPYFTATKIDWVRRHDTATWRRIESGECRIGTIDSYLVARFTGGRAHVTDATNASRTLLYDLATGAWSPRLCEIFGVPMSSLPRIVSSYGEIAVTDPASFLGIEAPITGIAGDQQAALIGQAGVARGSAKCTYGTGSFLLVNTGPDVRHSSHGLLTTVALQDPFGGRQFALEGSAFVAGSAVQWLRDGLAIISTASEVEDLALSVPDSGGVVFVPALAGLGAPDWDPHAAGLLVGLTRGTTRGHIARAVLEAIAYQTKDLVDLMSSEAGIDLAELRIDGGASANNLLCQLQADAIGCDVDRSAELQATALGAAFLAGMGAGSWTSWNDVSAVRASSGRFSPRSHLSVTHASWRDAVARSMSWSI